MIRVGYARNLARKLVKDLKLSGPPVSEQEAARLAGLDVIPYDFPPEISGVLVYSGDIKAIGVNKSHAPVRQRFSIAHELGHFMLRHDNDFFLDFSDPAISQLGEEQADNSAEIEANEFAAELLMPMDMLKQDYKTKRIRDPKELARRYKVSEQALWIRLLSLKLV
jgi:Zn-dependent peptidase ImmA (M78 family)